MTDKRTPGEWRVKKRHNNYAIIADMPCVDEPNKTLPVTVAVTSTESNADFIAAATKQGVLRFRQFTGPVAGVPHDWVLQHLRSDGTSGDLVNDTHYIRFINEQDCIEFAESLRFRAEFIKETSND